MSQIINSETSRQFGKAVLEAIGVDDDHILADSIVVEIDSGSNVGSVRWEGAAHISREQLAEITERLHS